MLHNITNLDDLLLKFIDQDPVRPHIPIESRIGNNRDIFVLKDQDHVLAITCVSYVSTVPDSENNLFDADINPDVAVFYTIWSYRSGAGRDLLFSAVDHIRHNRKDITRFVTLSPKTEMAHRFHITNGARVLRQNDSTVNYEYC